MSAAGAASTAALYAWLVDSYGQERAAVFWKWLTVGWPGWERDLAVRLDRARVVSSLADS